MLEPQTKMSANEVAILNFFFKHTEERGDPGSMSYEPADGIDGKCRPFSGLELGYLVKGWKNHSMGKWAKRLVSRGMLDKTSDGYTLTSKKVEDYPTQGRALYLLHAWRTKEQPIASPKKRVIFRDNNGVITSDNNGVITSNADVRDLHDFQHRGFDEHLQVLASKASDEFKHTRRIYGDEAEQ
jgi:hypothetical protein